MGRKCVGGLRGFHIFFFADDSILFAKASLQECSKIADIISIYEGASGQKVNLSKTEVVFSKCVSRTRRAEIVATLGVREVERHEKYLGLPTIMHWKVEKGYFCLSEGTGVEKATGVEREVAFKTRERDTY